MNGAEFLGLLSPLTSPSRPPVLLPPPAAAEVHLPAQPLQAGRRSAKFAGARQPEPQETARGHGGCVAWRARKVSQPEVCVFFLDGFLSKV